MAQALLHNRMRVIQYVKDFVEVKELKEGILGNDLLILRKDLS
jgi:hypothetical protein